MASVTVRNLDDELVASLKLQAKANHRSLEGEIRYILDQHALRATRLNRFRLRAKDLRDSSAEFPQTDSVELIRKDRDR